MAQPGSTTDEVKARIVYWGIPGAGVSASLRRIHARLRADHRSELQQVPTRLDPTVTYEVLPIELGVINGTRTRLHLIAVPGEAEHLPTRKQLLDRIDGLVLVVDCQRARIQENLASFRELREMLEAYGRSLEDVPTVVQYNKSDLGDPGVVEELHRGLGLVDVAAFETIAAEGSGVLQALTTISKRVVRVLRDRTLEQPHKPPTPVETEAPEEDLSARVTAEDPPTRFEAKLAQEDSPFPTPRLEPRAESTLSEAPQLDASPVQTEIGNLAPAPPASALDLMEEAILAEDEQIDEDVANTAFEAQTLLDCSWDEVAEKMKSAGEARLGADLRIVSVGTASRTGDRALRIPLVLGNADGESVTLALSIQLDPVLDGEEA
jgi:signal recognition particle receptor subunit beta